MAIAIIRAGGKQFSVEKGTTVRVPSLKHEVGASIELEMLAATGDKETRVYKRTRGHRQGYTTLKIDSIG